MNQQRQNWWSRNWKWCLPVGCIGLVTICLAFMAVIFLLVFGIMKSSDAYQQALALAQAHPSVRQALGTPIKEGAIVSGNINTTGDSGQADLSIPISGPKGKGALRAVGKKLEGKWSFSTLVVEIEETGSRIDLLSNEKDEQ